MMNNLLLFLQNNWYKKNRIKNRINNNFKAILNEEVDWSRSSEKPLNEEKWKSMFDEKGRLKDPERLKRDIYYGVY